SVSTRDDNSPAPSRGNLIASNIASAVFRILTRTYSRRPSFFLYLKAARTGIGISGVGVAPERASTVGRTTWTKVTKLATGLPGRPISGVPSTTPIATGRPGLVAIRPN